LTSGRRKGLDHIREEYLEWLLIDKRTRQVHGMPATSREFAGVKGVSDRALRRWKQNPVFAERLEQRRVEVAQGRQGGAVSAAGLLRSYPHTDPRAARRFAIPKPAQPEHDRVVEAARAEGTVDPDLLDYASVKQAIRDAAAKGDGKSLELYMKHWGHEHAAAERMVRESSFADLTDDQLVDETLTLFGVETVAAWLDSRTVV
jgi:hypothetical protein